MDDESSNFQGWMDANNSIYVLVDYCEVLKLKLRVCQTFRLSDGTS